MCVYTTYMYKSGYDWIRGTMILVVIEALAVWASHQQPQEPAKSAGPSRLRGLAAPKKAPSSTPQLRLKTRHIPTNRDHKALNRGTLGGLGYRGACVLAKGTTYHRAQHYP